MFTTMTTLTRIMNFRSKITFPQYIAVLENKVFEERKQENSRGCGRKEAKRVLMHFKNNYNENFMKTVFLSEIRESKNHKIITKYANAVGIERTKKEDLLTL